MTGYLMLKSNFRLRILIYFIVVAILPFITSWMLLHQKVDTKMKQDFEALNYSYVQNQTGKIDVMFKKQEDVMKSLAAYYKYMDRQNVSINSFLETQLNLNNQFTNLYIINPDGTVTTAVMGERKLNLDFTTLHSYINAKKNKGLVWLEPYTDPLSNEKCVGLSMPVYNREGQEEGVLVGNLSMKALGDMISSAKYMPDVEMYLINSSGYIKYDAQGVYRDTANIGDSNFILNPVAADIKANSEGIRKFSFQNKNWLCTYSVINSNGWKIVSILDSDKFLARVGIVNKGINSFFIVLAVLSMLLAVVASVYLSKTIAKPLLKLRDGAREIAAGNLDSRVEFGGNDEIRELGDTLNEMAGNLKSTYLDLMKRTEELFENNEQLQETNVELEASYEQLEATMGQLNQSEEKYKMLINNISEMVFVINMENTIVYINESVENVLGYMESDLIGRQADIMLKDKAQLAVLKEALINEYSQYQCELVKKDGSTIIVEGSAKRVIEEDRIVGIQTISRDITQRKLMEESLQQKYNELKVLNKVSKAITSTIDMNILLDIVVNQVIDIADALDCSVRLIDARDEQRLVLKAIQGIKSGSMSIRDYDIEYGPVKRVIETKLPYIIEFDGNNTPGKYYKLLYGNEKARYMTLYPLIVQGNVIGIMSATTRRRPSDDQLDLVGLLANNIAMAIDNARAYDDLKQSYLKTVQSLVSAVEAKDLYTESHSIRVANYSAFIAAEMGFSKSFIEDIWVAGVLHDIGKIGISDSILNKSGKLTDEEYEIVKQHPGIAYKILSKIGLDAGIIDAIRHHHERYDGRGYPDMLDGGEISVMASIISVADAFDAITSDRPYRVAKTIRQGINEIIDNRGSQFDPKIVDVFETAYLTKNDMLEKIYNDEDVKFF